MPKAFISPIKSLIKIKHGSVKTEIKRNHRKKKSVGMVTHACNLCTREAEAREWPNLG